MLVFKTVKPFNTHERVSRYVLFRKTKLVALIIVLIFFSQFLYAEEVDEIIVDTKSINSDEVYKLETIVVTGSLTAKTPATLTTISSVITAEDIAKLNKRNVTDLLRTIPGINISQQGGQGGAAEISIRGGESNYTLVLIDGVQVNDPTNTRGGSYNFNQLSIQEIERIEITRGPQSAIYGSDALSGVINIITHKNQIGTQQNITLSGGGRDYQAGTYSISHQASSIASAIKLSSQRTGEQVEGSEYNRDTINANFAFHIDDVSSISTQLRATQVKSTSFPEQSGGPLYAVFRDLDELEAAEQTAMIIYSREISNNLSLDLSADYFDKDSDRQSPGVADFFNTNLFPFQEALEYKKYTHKLLTHLKNINNFTLSFGVEIKQEEGFNNTSYDFAGSGFNSGLTNLSQFSLDRFNNAVFSEAGYSFELEDQKKLLVNLSARSDKFKNKQSSYSDIPLPPSYAPAGNASYESDGRENSYHLGSKFFVSDFILFANYGEAFKLPSFFALSEANVGNPNLKNELSKSYDLGFEWQFTEKQNFVASYFNNRFENLITFSGIILNVPYEVQVEGAELTYNWSSTETLDFSLNTTYSHIKGQKDASAITYDARPQWLANLISSWSFKSKWQSTLALRWVDEMLSSSSFASSPHTLDAYTLVDLSLAFNSKSLGSYGLAIDNLLDEDYEEAWGFPGMGRTLRGTWSLDF